MSRTALVVLGWLVGCGEAGDPASDAAPAPDAMLAVSADWSLEFEPPGLAVGRNLEVVGDRLALIAEQEGFLISFDGEPIGVRPTPKPSWDARGHAGGVVGWNLNDSAERTLLLMDPDLVQVRELVSPIEPISLSVRAQDGDSVWLFGSYIALDGQRFLRVGEVPFDGEPRSWADQPSACGPYPLGGIVTAAGRPLFMMMCGLNQLGALYSIVIDVESGAISKKGVAVGFPSTVAVATSWMVPYQDGALAVYRVQAVDAHLAEDPVTIFAVRLDAEGEVTAGPTLVWQGAFADDSLWQGRRMVVVGDRAYGGGERFLYSFDAESIGDYRAHRLPLPDGAEDETAVGHSLAAAGDGLYRFRDVLYRGGRTPYLVQKLHLPPP